MAQYMYGVIPCSLCYYQRYAMCVITISSLGIVISGYDKKYFTSMLCLIAFSGMILTSFHIGVEQKWWSMPKSCLTNIEITTTDPTEMLKSLNQQMKNQKVSRCDTVNWYLFGLPASWWTFSSFVFATIMMVFREWKIKKK